VALLFLRLERREKKKKVTEEDRRVDGAFEGEILIIAAISGDIKIKSQFLPTVYMTSVYC